MIKVAIIGSGPSAFYAAQALFKSENASHILIICIDLAIEDGIAVLER